MNNRSAIWAAVVLISLAAFLCHFYYMSQFGFYEDDYWATVPFIGDKLSSAWSIVAEAFQQWPQGRPLNHSLPKLQAILGMRLGGVDGIYAIACVAFVFNALLVFALLRRFFGEKPALVGAMLYVFFPADVTRPFLVHAAHVQGSMTFFLLGSWLWFRGGWWRVTGYLVAALSLLSYETAFLPFLTIPLLAGDNLRTTWKSWARHLLVCFGIVVAYLVLRLSRGESRAVGVLSDLWTTAQQALSSLYLGPLTSGTRMIQAPLEGLARLDATAVLCALLIGLVVYLTLNLGRSQEKTERAASLSPLKVPAALYYIACALLTWAGSYALTFVNYPPTQTLGRLTSTHTAAAWGVALLGCVVVAWFRGIAFPRSLTRVAVALGLVYVIGSVGFSQWVQREYARSWLLQQTFWRQVVTLTPEAGDGWSVIVVGPQAPSAAVMFTNSWADTLAYRALVNADVDFGQLDFLGPAAKLTRQNGTLQWTPQFWNGNLRTIDEDKLIILKSDGSRLERVTEAVTKDGIVLHGKADAGVRALPPNTPLSEAMWAAPGG